MLRLSIFTINPFEHFSNLYVVVKLNELDQWMPPLWGYSALRPFRRSKVLNSPFVAGSFDEKFCFVHWRLQRGIVFCSCPMYLLKLKAP